MSETSRPIARIWRGRTPASRAVEYAEFLVRRALPDYRSTRGNRGAQVLRHTEGDVAEFVVVSFWDAWDSIRRFAGEDPSRAVYYPEDDGFLLEKEPTVTHYEVFE